MKVFGKFASVMAREIDYKGEKRTIYPAEFVAGGDTFLFDIWSSADYVQKQNVRTDAAGDIELEFEKRTYYDKNGILKQQQSIRFKSFRPANMQTQRMVDAVAVAASEKVAAAANHVVEDDGNMPF